MTPKLKQNQVTSQWVTWCNSCDDTAFEVLEKKTNKRLNTCCRCGNKMRNDNTR